MKKQALTAIGIKKFAPLTWAAGDEPPWPVSKDSEAYASKPEARRSAELPVFNQVANSLPGKGLEGQL